VPGNQKVPALLKEKAPVFLVLALNMNKLYDPTPNPMFFCVFDGSFLNGDDPVIEKSCSQL